MAVNSLDGLGRGHNDDRAGSAAEQAKPSRCLHLLYPPATPNWTPLADAAKMIPIIKCTLYRPGTGVQARPTSRVILGLPRRPDYLRRPDNFPLNR